MGKQRTERRRIDAQGGSETKGALDSIRHRIQKMAGGQVMWDVGLLLFGAIIGGVITLIVSQVYFERSKSLAHVAMQRKIPRLQVLPALFKVGTNLVMLNAPGQHMRISNLSPYTYEVGKDGTILLAGDVRDIQGRVVAHLRDSNLYVSPGMNYDVNSDMEAIEIVDEQLCPILQLRKLSSDEINKFALKIPALASRPTGAEVLEVYHVAYAFVPGSSKPRAEIADEQGLTMTGDLPLALTRSKGIKRLFEYPGYRKPGVRKNWKSR